MNNVKRCVLTFILIFTRSLESYELTNLTRNEPYSFYTTRYRYEFLDNALKYELFTGQPHPHERFRFTATPFRTSATDKDIDVNRLPDGGSSVINVIPEITGFKAGRNFKKERVPLGDIKGRLNMLALFYDDLVGCPDIPPNATLQESTTLQKQCPAVQYFYQTLQEFINPPANKLDILFPNTIAQPELQQFITTTCITEFIDPINTDTNEFLGFFSIPLDYKKHGIRFDLDFSIFQDFDIEVNVGFAEIKQTNTKFIDLSCAAPIITCTDCCGDCNLAGVDCTCLQYLDDFLMRKVRKIAKELDINIKDFCISGFEDIRMGMHWHHTYAACPDPLGNPVYLFTPFILAEGSIPVADKVSPRTLLALPLGNNGHGAIGFTAGFNFDYYNFMSIGFDAGLTHFASRQYFDVPMPTECLQAVFFPFSVDACIQPGNNWHASASVLFYELYYRISIFTQYLTVSHDEDKVFITKDLRLEQPLLPDPEIQEQFEDLGGFASLPPFQPRIYERESAWDYQSIIFGFNYDFCDNYGLGFLWQLPISGRRSYSVTTLAFTFSAVY